MNCRACEAPLVPGVDRCVSCGEPIGDERPVIELRVFGLDISPEAIAKLEAERAANIARIELFTKARVLEISGDIDGPEGAIAAYEKMIAAGYDYPAGFKRLAIIYRRAKRLGDEERIVRLALTRKTIQENLSKNWFVLRLATITAKQKKEREREGAHAAGTIAPVAGETYYGYDCPLCRRFIPTMHAGSGDTHYVVQLSKRIRPRRCWGCEQTATGFIRTLHKAVMPESDTAR